MRMLAYRLTERLADVNTNVSEVAVEAFIEKGAVKNTRIQVVYNGIDTERFALNLREKLRFDANIGPEEKIILL